MFKIIGADGKEYGPVEAVQLRAWTKEGRVDGSTLAQAEGGTEWKPLSSYAEFFSLPATPPPLSPISGATSGQLRLNGFAITGMIMGILSVTLCFCCYGFPCNLLGFIFSLVALSQIKQSPHVYTGRGMAITGLVLSLVSFGIALSLLLFGTAFNWAEFQREVDVHL